MQNNYYKIKRFNKAAKTNAIAIYILLLLGAITGVFWFLGGLWAMYKKGSVQNTLFEDHISNAINVFWIGLISKFFIWLFFLLVITSPIAILILIPSYAWILYKIIRGLVRVISNQPYGVVVYPDQQI